MAFADKITYMRRMAIIVPTGHIMWEGVNIDGVCLLRSPGDGEIMCKSEHKLNKWVESENSLGAEYTIKYCDSDDEEHWEPRKEEKEYSLTELVLKFLQFIKLDGQNEVDDIVSWIHEYGIEWDDIIEEKIPVDDDDEDIDYSRTEEWMAIKKKESD